jgi:hypothetical protein
MPRAPRAYIFGFGPWFHASSPHKTKIKIDTRREEQAKPRSVCRRTIRRFGVDYRASVGSVGLSYEMFLKDLANESISDEKDDEQDDEWNFIFLVLPTIIWCSLRRAKAIQELVFALVRGQQRQLQVPAGSFEGSKPPRSLQHGCESSKDSHPG